MTPDELKQIIEAVKPVEKTESSKMTDMIFKAFSTISLLLIAWVLNTVNDLKTSVTDLSKDQEYGIQTMQDFKAFTEKPRFALEDFQQRIIPLTNQVNSNTAELNNRNSFMDKTDNRVQELELEVRILKGKIEDLK